MFSYQHIYHAGNAADVHKHLWLVAVLEYLRRKDRPVCWIDTHGGRGLYDLRTPEAKKLAEYKSGFLAVRRAFETRADLPLVLRLYLGLAGRINKGGETEFYPGSSLIAAHMLGEGDALYSFDMHPREIPHLQAALKSFKCASARREDGYKALKAMIPPPQKRGGVLIDPSYEVKGEYAQVLEAVCAALKKWPQGVFMIWYPLLPAGAHKALADGCAELAGGRTGIEILADEWIFRDPAANGRGLYGSGMIVVNPPYTTPETMAELKSLVLPVLTGSVEIINQI